MKTKTLKLLLVLPLLAALGCAGEQQAEEMPETEAMQETAEAQPEEQMEMAAETYTIEVTNPMPHEMIVYEVSESGEMELGSVPANGTTQFTITGPRSMELQLKATDAAETHSVGSTVKLTADGPATWTIQ